MRVQLVRIEGKLDLSNARHDGVDKRLDNHEQRLHRHSSDISLLQAESNHRKGERAGCIASGKLFYSVLGGGLLGIIALLWKAFV